MTGGRFDCVGVSRWPRVVSKSGVSTSLGGKGLSANLSKKGTRVTGSISGTGLSASKLYASGRAGSDQKQSVSFGLAAVVVGIALLVWFLSF
ncbi:DUF4236 domain-containing protein [Pseudomonas segetis]|uniref:DUF4236 domain-containing protein n=1 Tax=Pseudomonas segetis TaxID=298908 RepID=UPI003CCBB1DC